MGLDLSILSTLNHFAQSSSWVQLVAVFAAVPLIWLLSVWYVVVFVWHKRGGLRELLAFTAGVAGGYLVKFIVGFWWLRPRPFAAGVAQLLITKPWGLSFPSGHSFFAFFLATLLYLHRPRWWWAYLVATAVALGRVAVGVHYPSDVLVGALIGTAFGLVTMWLEQQFKPKSGHQV